MASNSEYSQDHSDPHQINVLFLASEWGSVNGGLSTINRELAINVAKCPEVNVTFFVPKCNDEDKSAAIGHNINLLQAERVPGMDELYWLCFPPHDLSIDVVVGHGVKLGPQAAVIKRSRQCKWFQVVHTAPEELAMHKKYPNPIPKGQKKHETEVELCELADVVVTIGPKLYENFRSYLSSSKKDEMVLNFTPGIFSEFAEVEQDPKRTEGKFKILIFGRGDTEDFELKGFDIAAKAVAPLTDAHLIVVGAQEGKEKEIKDFFSGFKIPDGSITVRRFLQNRESLKKVLYEADLAVMPSKTEGFGLTGLEALSAGLPILVSRNSGFGEALSKLSFGSHFVVDSDDPTEWSRAIKKAMKENREKRLTEVDEIRTKYTDAYSWKAQCEELIGKMIYDNPVREKEPNNERIDQQGPKEKVSLKRDYFGDQCGHRQEMHEENPASQKQITELHEKLSSNEKVIETILQQQADLHRKVQGNDQYKQRLWQQIARMQQTLGTNKQEMSKMRFHLGDLQRKERDKEIIQEQLNELRRMVYVKQKLEMTIPPSERLYEQCEFEEVPGKDQDKERLEQQLTKMQRKISANKQEMEEMRLQFADLCGQVRGQDRGKVIFQEDLTELGKIVYMNEQKMEMMQCRFEEQKLLDNPYSFIF